MKIDGRRDLWRRGADRGDCNGHHATIQQLIEAQADLDDMALLRVASKATTRSSNISSRRRPTSTTRR